MIQGIEHLQLQEALSYSLFIQDLQFLPLPCKGDQCYPHFTDEKTEANRSNDIGDNRLKPEQVLSVQKLFSENSRP